MSSYNFSAEGVGAMVPTILGDGDNGSANVSSSGVQALAQAAGRGNLIVKITGPSYKKVLSLPMDSLTQRSININLREGAANEFLTETADSISGDIYQPMANPSDWKIEAHVSGKIKGSSNTRARVDFDGAIVEARLPNDGSGQISASCSLTYDGN